MQHRTADDLREASFPESGYIAKIPTASGKSIIKYGAGVPSGTPDAFLYVNTSYTAATDIFYIGVSGSWAALSLSTV